MGTTQSSATVGGIYGESNVTVRKVIPTNVELGSSAYGKVQEIKFRDSIGDFVCVAKTLHAELVQDLGPNESNYVTRTFQNECELMSTLTHPNIVTFLGIGNLPGSRQPALLMERLETDLQKKLETTRNISLMVKQSLLTDIAKGLHYLHSHSPPIIHRDLTARNVLLTSNMTAKIADLGMAKLVNMTPGLWAATMTRGPGNIIYMPPEALEDHAQYSTPIDIFSFGNIMLFRGEISQ